MGNGHSALAVVALLCAPTVHAQTDSALTALVANYTGLYTRANFSEWTRLFGPGFTSASANRDGTLTVRTLTQFIDAQRQGFARAREMREELLDVRVNQQGRLASVWADFVFYYDGTPSKGKLALLAVSDSAGWRFHSLIFSYDQ